jgi:DNA-binding GntR family transcriptional regulator
MVSQGRAHRDGHHPTDRFTRHRDVLYSRAHQTGRSHRPPEGDQARVTNPVTESASDSAGAPPDAQYRVDRARQSLRLMTVAAIRRAILELRFQPGERLVERELCEMTGVSRSSVREALRQLEAEGLVVSIPHRGQLVATLNPQDAAEIYEVRGALESLAARLFVANAPEAEVAELAAVAEACADAVTVGDSAKLLVGLDRFYQCLFRGAGNRTAAAMARTLHVRVSYLRALTSRLQDEGSARESIECLRQIVRATHARDADGAAEACLRQVSRSRRVALAVIEHAASGDPNRAAAKGR